MAKIPVEKRNQAHANASDCADTYEIASIREYELGNLTFADLVASIARHPSTVRSYIAQFRESGTIRMNQKGKRSGGRQEHRDKEKALSLVKERYSDFGPKFAAEKLEEIHQIKVSAETLRKWMQEADIWVDRKSKPPRIFQLREPRPRRGELVQVDGSHHRWLEKRGPELCLLVFIDDATSEIMFMRFCKNESSYEYMHALRGYIYQHGLPLALYSDRYSVFRTPVKGKGGRKPTQFARACTDLKIGVICAETPQAKGRVERANRTLQDRLIKEMRLRNISTLDEANAYLENYRRDHNRRFARPPISEENAHRPPPNQGLDRLLTYCIDRKVFRDLHVSYNKMTLILDDTPLARSAIGKRVTVPLQLDGTLEVLFREECLPFRVFDKMRRVVGVPKVSGSKRLASALATALIIQEKEPHHFQRNGHVLAGFRKLFSEPMDDTSIALREAPAEIRKKHRGRHRARLSKRVILVDKKNHKRALRQLDDDD